MDVSTFTARRRSLSADGGEIAYAEFAYAEFGDAGAPAALFVHGLATGGLMWRHVIERLSGTTRCIAVDLPAHGGTPARGGMSVAAMAGCPQSRNTSSVNHRHRRGMPSSRRTVGVYPSSSCARS